MQRQTFSPVMQLFGSSDEKGSLLNRTANRAKMLTERDACVTATRRDVLVESRLLPEGRAELHACGLVALRVADFIASSATAPPVWLAGSNRMPSSIAESTVNQVISRRFVRKQQMRWQPETAHLLLELRTRTLNGKLRETFQHRWPAMTSVSAAALS
jgi:hypothetical protein